MAKVLEDPGHAMPEDPGTAESLGWRAWAGIWGMLALLALLAASRLAMAGSVPPSDALTTGLLDWMLWGPVLLCVPLLVRAAPLAREHLGRSLLVHVPASVLASLAQITAFAAASALVRELRFGGGSLAAEWRSGFFFKFNAGVVVYWAAALFVQALFAGRRSRAEALRRAELDRRLSETRLEVLRAQLEPHFLFNTLNAITASIRRDPDQAEGMLVSLADLLRASLASRERQELPLREELEVLDDYLSIQRARFGPRLTVTVDVRPEVLDARLPSFMLQPLVENAIQHGIAARPGPGTVEVRAWRANGRLELRVRDDGPGPDEAAESGARRGLGLDNTRDRLRLLYGDRQELELRPVDGAGAEVAVALPYRGAKA